MKHLKLNNKLKDHTKKIGHWGKNMCVKTCGLLHLFFVKSLTKWDAL